MTLNVGGTLKPVTNKQTFLFTGPLLYHYTDMAMEMPTELSYGELLNRQDLSPYDPNCWWGQIIIQFLFTILQVPFYTTTLTWPWKCQ